MSAYDRSVSCCFTGHRPEKMPFAVSPYSYDYFQFQKKLEQAIQTAILSGYQHFITGMSRGMDLWAAQCVLNFRRAYPFLTLEAAIPFPGQADRWNEKDRQIYQQILQNCDDSVILSPRYTAGCMQRRNCYMVDHASLVIAAFDGSAGGTKNTCDYAAHRGVPVENILSDFSDGYSTSLI